MKKDAYSLCSFLRPRLNDYPQYIRYRRYVLEVLTVEAVNSTTYRVLTYLGWHTFTTTQRPFVKVKEGTHDRRTDTGTTR